MHKLYELKDKLIDELEAYADNGKYSKEDVEAIKYMASAVDHLCNIIEEADEKYSGDMMMDGVRSYARGGNRRSYARRRDAMGRYSRDGYSMAKDDLAEELRDLMQDAPDQQTKHEIKRIVDRLSQM